MPSDQAPPDQALDEPLALALGTLENDEPATNSPADWHAPLLAYLLDEVLPQNKIEV